MKKFEVTYRDLLGKDRFDDEYGFGTNPPDIIFAKSKTDVRKKLRSKLKRDNVKIVSIESTWVS